MRAYAGHVPLPKHLMLPFALRHAQEVVQSYDPDLRLRMSVEHQGIGILERRVRRRPQTNAGMRDVSDMHVQARDGYLHVASVHPSFLTKPHRIIVALREQGLDVWAEGGHERVDDELLYEEEWARVTRKRRRMGIYRDIALEQFDVMNRLPGSDRSRISAPGPVGQVAVH